MIRKGVIAVDDFDLERDLENAGIDAFSFSLMDEDERREALGEADLDPDEYEDIEFDSAFDAWHELQDAGLSLRELDLMDEDDRREALEDAGLDPADYELSEPFVYSPSRRAAEIAPPPAPQPTPVQPPAPKTYRFVSVRFTGDDRVYAYRTYDRSIRPGDRVIVPARPQNGPAPGTVVSVGDYTEGAAPYPPDKAKLVLRKAAAEDPEPPPEETPAAPAIAESTEADPEEEREKRQRKALVITVAVLFVIFAVLSCIILFRCSRIEPAPAPENTAVPISAAYAAGTPAAAPRYAAETRAQLDDLQTDLRITELVDRLEDVSGYLSEYNAVMWLPDAVSVSEDDIVAYERAWSGYASDAAAIRREMDAAVPSALFAASWNDLYGFVSAVQELAERLSDWDMDHDGDVTDKECMLVNNMALDAAVEARSCIERMNTDYDAAHAAWSARSAAASPRATSKPAPTPKRSRSTPRPDDGDPYNARDYAYPDDFYYDYYDDFWDYYDAEDYWEEWND